jgi:hypothetical protein
MTCLSQEVRWYATSTPPAGGSSVCTVGVTSGPEPEPGQLLINPSSISGIINGGHNIETEIAREADDSVFVEYGIDWTSLFWRSPAASDIDAQTCTTGEQGTFSAAATTPILPRGTVVPREVGG